MTSAHTREYLLSRQLHCNSPRTYFQTSSQVECAQQPGEPEKPDNALVVHYRQLPSDEGAIGDFLAPHSFHATPGVPMDVDFIRSGLG